MERRDRTSILFGAQLKNPLFFIIATAAALTAGGYKIPETSLNAVALSAANVAHAQGADSAYYNPANMVFMKDQNVLEADLIYIGLQSVKYTSASTDIASEREDFLVPSLHYVSNEKNGARFGLSVVSAAGLAKRWEEAPARYTAREFSLQTVEFNPSVALKINDNLSAAIGLRAVYAKGKVKSTSPLALRDMQGDSIGFGYNFALSYKPFERFEAALTYRSKVDLHIKGDASLAYLADASQSSARVSVPVPALLNLAFAYTLPSKTTFEFVYERNFWSEYKELDFNYGSGVSPVTNALFGAPLTKNYRDTNSLRLGITQKFDALTLMGGAVIDKTPVPNTTIGFELPDSDSFSLSCGARYKINKSISVGLALLYSMRESREVANETIEGKFSDGNILIASSAIEYKF